MIKISLIGSGRVEGFVIKGHSGYAEEGSDIICASVSSAAYMAANTITEIVGAHADAEVKDGYMSFRVKEADDERTKTVLDGFVLHIRELCVQFPEYVSIESNQ